VKLGAANVVKAAAAAWAWSRLAAVDAVPTAAEPPAVTAVGVEVSYSKMESFALRAPAVPLLFSVVKVRSGSLKVVGLFIFIG